MGFEKEIKEEVGIIGIFLDGESLRIGKVMNEKIVSSSSKIIDNLGSEEIIISEIISAISEIIDEDVLGIGIGVPSIVDVKEGIVYNPMNIPAWHEVHLKEILEQKFLVPVVVNNDANCFAIGQKHFGKAKNYKNIVGLFVGVGLGAGIIIENKLYSGDNSAAGEFGMMPYRDHIYEYYCSLHYFEKEHNINHNDLLALAQKQDPNALKLYREYGTHLGNAIKTILFALDPEIIVIGGAITPAFPHFEQAMWESINEFQFKRTLNKLKITTYDDPDIRILGAAALYLDSQV